MKRYVSLIGFFLFLCMIFLFQIYGTQIRDFLSPKVVCEDPGWGIYDNSVYMVIPLKWMTENENGYTVFTAVPTDAYPETAYAAKEVTFMASYVTEDFAYVNDPSLDASGKIIISSDRPLVDGQRICIQKSNST